jgi:succinylglutamic semialdehyde dehydrogenase
VAEPELFEPRGDLIDGRFRLPEAATGEIRAQEPGDTERELGAFPFALESVDEAVDAARRAWPAWRDASPEERARPLERLAAAIESHAEQLAVAIAREVGKPLWEARTEVAAMVGKLGITLTDGMDLVAERRFETAPGQQARWRAHARGVMSVLGPFNFPGHLVHGHVVPALATGNCCVIKPSDHTPAVGQLYAELLLRADFPPGVINVVQGDGAIGAALAAHADVDGVLFTGSWGVGRRILEATLDQPRKLVALEMGGKNSILVQADADLDAAVFATVFGATVTAGQRCSATSRAIVHRSVAAAFSDRLAAVIAELRVGDPLEPDVFMGPVITAAARERHAELHAWAREDGAECLVAGGPSDGPRAGHWVRPSLHRVARHVPTSRYQAEEHFVPDLHVLEVDELDEAITILNQSDYGLVASVFSRERESFERVWRASRVGLLNWNTSTVGASSRLPFGGIGKSGNDRAAGVTSTLYCTYPVASVEVAEPATPKPPPGFPWPP